MSSDVDVARKLLEQLQPVRQTIGRARLSPCTQTLYTQIQVLLGTCRQIIAEQSDVRDMAVKLCEAAGEDPFEHIKGGAAVAWEDYGERWQAYRRAEGQIMGPDWQLLAEIALGKKQ